MENEWKIIENHRHLMENALKMNGHDVGVEFAWL